MTDLGLLFYRYSKENALTIAGCLGEPLVNVVAETSLAPLSCQNFQGIFKT